LLLHFLWSPFSQVLFIVVAVLGLWWRGRAPLWLPIVAAVTLVVQAVATIIAGPAGYSVANAVVAAWLSVSAACLVLATEGRVRRWRATSWLLIVGLVAPLPYVVVVGLLAVVDFATALVR